MGAKENVEVASAVFREYGVIIRNTLERCIQSEQDVDDIYQDIYLSIVASPPSHDTSILAYVKTVARNHVRDFYRRGTSRRGFAERYAGFLKTTAVGEDRETELDGAEQVRKALDLLGCALPPYMARIVIERYIHSKSVDEIALELGIEKRSVSHYCCVGLKRLRHLLDE